MAAALVLPALAGATVQQRIGAPILVTGTGFANTTAYTCTITTPDETEDVVFKGSSSGGGAINLATDGGTFTPEIEGFYTVTVVCGSDTLSCKVEVFVSE
jgi:hypothetical protein